MLAVLSDVLFQPSEFLIGHWRKQFSRWMDTAFEVPLVGWRFGLDAILGLIPGLGDAATTIVSLYLLALASRAGVLWIATQGLFSEGPFSTVR